MENNKPLAEANATGVYRIKAKVSVKDKTSLMSFSSSDLTWPNKGATSDSKNPAWSVENGSYVWEPGGKNLFIKIPLQQKNQTGNFSTKKLEEIQVEYQDLFSNNPTIPSAKIVVFKKKSPATANKKKLTESNVLFFQGSSFAFNKDLFKNISSAPWQKKENLYLIRRTLGLNFDAIWRYAIDRHYTVFQRRFNKDLQSVEVVDLIVNGKIDEYTLDKIVCNFRISYAHSRSLHVIPHKAFDPIIFKSRDKSVIRYRVGDFFRRAVEKKQVAYLKELIIFFPESLEKVLFERPVESILFQRRGKELSRLLENEEPLKNKTPSSQKQFIPITDQVMQVQDLSIKTKRLIIKLPKVMNSIEDDTNLKSIDLLFRPTSQGLKGGFNLQRARKITRNIKKIQSIFATDNKKIRRWGGPFLSPNQIDKKFERIQINALFPFENFDKSIPYGTNEVVQSGISVQTSDNALFRLLKSNEGLICDFWFFSENAIATLRLSEVGPFEQRQNITLNWDLKGPLEANIVDFPATEINNSSRLQFLLKKKTSPTLIIKANRNAFKDNYRGVRGRLIFKNVQNHGPVDSHFLNNFKNQSNSSQEILCEAHLGSKTLFFPERKVFDCQNFFNSFITSDRSILPEEKSNKLTKKNFIQSRGVTVRTEKNFSQWYSMTNGLKLEGKGKWIEIDWPVKTFINKNTLFYLGVPKGADSIATVKIIPFAGEHQLAHIPTIPNQSVRLNLAGKSIDHLKLRFKLSEKYPFNLVLQEMALFEPIAVTEAQAIDISKEWNGTSLKPEQVQSKMIGEISIENAHLKATVLPKQGRVETVSWHNKINQKSQSIGWLKTKYRISPSAYFFNPCWLKVIWVGKNQKTSQTICTKSFKGRLLIPVSDSFMDDLLESIHWETRIGLPPTQPSLPVSFELKVVPNENNETTSRNNIINFPLLKVRGKKVFPVSLTNTTAEEIISNENKLDLGVHSISTDTFDTQNFTVLDHPYLHINFFSFKKINGHEKGGPELLWELPLPTATSDKFSFLSVLYKFLLVPLTIILLIRWLWSKKGRLIIRRRVEEIIILVKNHNQRLLIFLRKVASFIHNKAIVLNRLSILGLIGLIMGMILSDSISREYIVFVSTVLLLLGVLWYEFRVNKNQKIPVSIHILSGALILWLVWLLAYSSQPPSRLLVPFLPLACFYMSWFPRIFRSLPRYLTHPTRFWLTVAGTTYFIGVVALVGGISFSSFLKILSAGHLAIIPCWSHLMKNIQTKIENRWASLAEFIYNEKENLYVAGFFVFLLAVTLFRILEFNLIAEQFAIIGFYLLATGLVLKTKDFFKQKKLSNGGL